MKKIIYLLILLSMASCASQRHRFMRGSIAMKIDDRKGIVCIEPGSVKKGDKLKFMNNNCSRPTFPDARGSCELVEAGEVEITKILNPHYAEFVKITGPDFSEGSIIGNK